MVLWSANIQEIPKGKDIPARSPPSHGHMTPVMKLDSSLSKNANSLAISSGRPVLCRGIAA
jgi:hypothetical protein